MSSELFEGQIVGGAFRVGRVLSAGTYGVVHLGSRLDDGAEVVIKTLRGDAGHFDPSAADRFVREATVAARLSHPNIVRTFNVGKTRDGVLYIVLERLHGYPLSTAMYGGPSTPPIVKMVACQVLRGLDFAHRRHVVHRDLKPSNIFVCDSQRGRSGGIKLIDFGFVKLLDPADVAQHMSLTQEGHIIGSPGYMAPELLDGHPASPASDLYALGIILYELLTGWKAYPGVGMERLAAQMTSKPPVVPPHVESLPIWAPVVSLMAPDATQRPASARVALRLFERLR